MWTKRLKTYFSQFYLFNALRILFADLNRRIFDPFCIPSYSQTGEDRLITSILGVVKTGFYVDVGCNHPQSYSNTFLLYKRGWKGISIDANPQLIRKHQRLRYCDLSICAVVSDQEHEVVFTDFNDSLVSSLSPGHVSKWERLRSIKSKRLVNTVSLHTILSNHNAPSRFDLLCIDVEGHDLEVVTSLDFACFRPKLIVIEMHGFNLQSPRSCKTYCYLRSNNYTMVGFAIMNGYFLDASKRQSDIIESHQYSQDEDIYSSCDLTTD